MLPTEIDLAYAAGVIDSDGSVHVFRQKRKSGLSTYVVRVDVTNISDEIPLWFLATFGGYLSKENPKKKSGEPRFCSVWRWRVNCRKALSFLRLVVPYLRLKRVRGELAIKLQETKSSRFGRIVPTPDGVLLEQARLATLIRAENRKTNPRISFTEKEIVVN